MRVSHIPIIDQSIVYQHNIIGVQWNIVIFMENGAITNQQLPNSRLVISE